MADIFQLQGSVSLNNQQALQGFDTLDNRVNSSQSNLSNRTANMVTGLGNTCAKIGTVLATGAIAVGTGVTKMFMPFQESVAQVSTLVTDKMMPQIKSDMKTLSNETGKDATKVGDAIYQGLSSGVSEENITDFTRKMNKLAKGGFTELATATDLTTTIINSYGLEIEATDSIMDKLITTQNRGKTTVAELGSTLGKVIPTANGLGVDLDNVASAMALATSKGIATAESATYLNAMMSELGKSGTITSNVLKEETGQSFKELMDSGMSLSDVLAIVKDNAEKNGKSLSDMFGSAEAGRMALTLLSGDGAEFTAMLEEMSNSAGASDEAFKKMDNTLQARVDKTVQKVKNSAISLGEAMLPIIEEKLVPAIEKFADWMSNLDDATMDNIANWVTWGAKLGAVLIIGGSALSLFGNISTSITSITTLFGGATAGIGGFSGILSTLTGPIGIAVTAVAGLTLAFMDNQKKCKEGNDALLEIGDGYDDFTGRVKTNDNILSAIFGKEYEFKFTEDFKNAVAEIEADMENNIQKAQEYNVNVKNILNGTYENDEERQTKIDEFFNAEIEALKRQQDNIKTQDVAHRKVMANNYKTYLTEELGYGEITANEKVAQYDKYYSEVQGNIDAYENEIVDIKNNAFTQQRELTADELAQIQILEQDSANERMKIAQQNGEDIFNAEQERMLKSKAILTEEYANLDESNKSKMESVANYIKSFDDEYKNKKKTIKDDMALTDEQKNRELNTLESKRTALDLFNSFYLETLNKQMKRGDDWATASERASENFCMALNNSEMSADDLTKALEEIPEEIRPEVLANIKGKAEAENLKAAIDKLQNKTITVTTKMVQSQGSGATKYASGSEGIPNRAYGDENFSNTRTALVGEQGPELVELPVGSKVKTHRETANASNNGDGNVYLQLPESLLKGFLGQFIETEMSKRSRQLGFGGVW